MTFKGQAGVLRTKRFSEKDLETIRRSENDQSQFRRLVAERKDFSDTEKAVVKLNTVDDFIKFWGQTDSARTAFDENHEKGFGLWAKSYQSSASVVHSFVTDFSPILDIVKNFGAPFGGLAVGVISVLFVVAKNKEKIEMQLTSAISAIKDRLPGLKMYQHIYNDDHELDIELQSQIVLAYECFIDFCIEATKYYKSGGSHRWLKAFGRPTSISEKADKVQSIVMDIRQTCDELLDKNVQAIKDLVIEQKSTIDSLEDQVGQLLKSQDDAKITEARRLLNLSSFSEETQTRELEKHRQSLESNEHLNAVYFEQMRGQRLDSFKANTDYRSWTESPKSRLLILSGRNNESISYLGHCWLSPVAMALIADLRQDTSNPAHAYYLFPGGGQLLFDVFSVIILQLLQQKSHVLRNKSQWDELRVELSELEKYDQPALSAAAKNKDDREDDRIAAYVKVFLRVATFFDESESVHIVLDGADRCCVYKREVDHRKALLKALVKIVEAAHCKLKVLVVINGWQWSVESRRDELGENAEGSVIVHTAQQGYRP